MGWDFWAKANDPGKGDIDYSKVSYKTNTWWYNKALIDKWIKAKAGKRKEKKAILKEIRKTEAKMIKLRKKGKHKKSEELQPYLNELRMDYTAIKV